MCEPQSIASWRMRCPEEARDSSSWQEAEDREESKEGKEVSILEEKTQRWSARKLSWRREILDICFDEVR